MIPTRPLGRTGSRVTELGLGGAGLGNLYDGMTDAAAVGTISAALDGGIGLVDTAPFYGFGLSERRVGDAIRGRAGVTVSTKAGRLLEPAPGADAGATRHGFRSPMPFEPRFDYTHDGILRSHEASLQRLGLARVEMLLVHDIGALTHGAEAPRRMIELIEGGGLKALRRLRDEGAVGAIGLGVNEVAACLELLPHAGLDVVLIAGRYTLLEQGALDHLFPAARAAGASLVIGGPYNSGVLAVEPGEDGHYDYGPVPSGVAIRVAALREHCRHHDVPLSAAALHFALAHPQVASVIPGARSPEEVRRNLEHHAREIPAALWRDLMDAGLIRRDAPVPA
jgi:D-threo-aldose 1-dehydrogenase